MPDPVRPRAHRVTVVCQGVAIDGWDHYSIQTSMIEAAQSFMLRRPFRADAWRILRRDARITVVLDGTTVITGPIDKRIRNTGENTIEISGRCFVGRLVQESAPSISYEKITLLEAVKRLADPFFTKVSTSGARDRTLRRGKGRKVVSGTEPLVVNVPVPRRGRIHPGTARWQVIEDLVSQAGYLAWGSADGKEIIVGSPNYIQEAQFLFCHSKPGSTNRTTTKTLTITEDNGDRYSLIAVVGTGGGDDANFGANTQRSGRAFDNIENSIDGTGEDFIFPKRLLMPERDFDKNKDALRAAEREQDRRDFRRTVAGVTMPDHGQFVGSGVRTIYAFNTIARVIDEEQDPVFDEPMLIFSCNYECDGRSGESTTMELVPKGTEFVL